MSPENVYNHGKNIRRLFKYYDKFLKTSKQIINLSLFSHPPPPSPPQTSMLAGLSKVLKTCKDIEVPTLYMGKGGDGKKRLRINFHDCLKIKKKKLTRSWVHFGINIFLTVIIWQRKANDRCKSYNNNKKLIQYCVYLLKLLHVNPGQGSCSNFGVRFPAVKSSDNVM